MRFVYSTRLPYRSRWTVIPLTASSVLLAASTAVAQVPAAAPGVEGSRSLGERFRAIERPQVVGELEVPPELIVGHAELRPAAGARLHLLADGERRVGIWLEGEAALRYRVTDRFSVPIARRNLKRLIGADITLAGGGLVLARTLRGAVIWGDDLVADDRPVRPAEGRELPAWVLTILDHQVGVNPAADLLVGRANRTAPTRMALFDAGLTGILVLDVDPRPFVAVETLARTQTGSARDGLLAGRVYFEELVAQPIGRAWWERPNVDLTATETEITVDNPRDEQVEITTRTRLVAGHDGVRLLPLTLLDEVYDERDRRRPHQVLSLTVDGSPRPYLHRLDLLLVELERPLAKGEGIWLETRTAGDLLVRPGSNSYWVLGLTPWYPRPALGVERASFRLSVSAARPFVPIVPGRIVEQTPLDGGSRVRSELPGPTEYIAVLAGRYSSLREEHAGLAVEVASYAFSKGEEARQVARNVLAIQICLANRFGVDYPFPDLRVVEVQDWGWGQAPAGLIFLTREHFLTAANARVGTIIRRRAQRTTPGSGIRLAHEVAHGYFPHVVKLDDPNDSWLSESFADYLAADCVRSTYADPELGRRAFDLRMIDWKNDTEYAGADSSVYLANHLSADEDGRRARSDLLYGKGPLVLHALREELARRKGGAEAGDRVFYAWLKAIVRAARPTGTGTADVVAQLERASADSWQDWFERYVYGTDVPPLGTP